MASKKPSKEALSGRASKAWATRRKKIKNAALSARANKAWETRRSV